MDRLKREQITVEKMIKIYCRQVHSKKRTLCDECQRLSDYSRTRLSNCRFGASKPACQNCAVHCYEKSMREKIKVVMRYSGPRMLLFHPVLAAKHLMDAHKKV